MTVKDVKAFLRSIRCERMEIQHLKEMIVQLESDLMPKAIRYDRDKVQTSPEEHFSKVCARISDYEVELGETIAVLMQKQLRAEKIIRKLDNEKEREVLRWYYLTTDEGELLTWGQVARRLNYNERYVKKLHGEALVHLLQKEDTF